MPEAAILLLLLPCIREQLTSAVTVVSDPKKSDIHCVVAGDMLNFQKDRETYDRERQFMQRIGARFFETTSRFAGGTWSYGYSPFYELWLVYGLMDYSYYAFAADVNSKMRFVPDSPKITTDNAAISMLNEGHDREGNANCLIFLSATQNASGLSTLNPMKKVNLTRIVAVSLRGIDLSSIVVPPKGVAVKASLDFTEEDISVIVDAVVKGF